MPTLCIKHRHLQCNLLFKTQYIEAIPPVLRCNLDLCVINKFANVESIIEQIYPYIYIYIYIYSNRFVFNLIFLFHQTPGQRFLEICSSIFSLGTALSCMNEL